MYGTDPIERVRAAESREAGIAVLTEEATAVNADLARRVAELQGDGPQGYKGGVGDNLEKRITRYLDAIKEFVKNFGPKQYQVSVGFPVGVSVAFTWEGPQPDTSPDDARFPGRIAR